MTSTPESDTRGALGNLRFLLSFPLGRSEFAAALNGLGVVLSGAGAFTVAESSEELAVASLMSLPAFLVGLLFAGIAWNLCLDYEVNEILQEDQHRLRPVSVAVAFLQLLSMLCVIAGIVIAIDATWNAVSPR